MPRAARGHPARRLRSWLDHANAEPLAALRCGLLNAEELEWHPVTKRLSKLTYQARRVPPTPAHRPALR